MILNFRRKKQRWKRRFAFSPKVVWDCELERVVKIWFSFYHSKQTWNDYDDKYTDYNLTQYITNYINITDEEWERWVS